MPPGAEPVEQQVRPEFQRDRLAARSCSAWNGEITVARPADPLNHSASDGDGERSVGQSRTAAAADRRHASHDGRCKTSSVSRCAAGSASLAATLAEYGQ